MADDLCPICSHILKHPPSPREKMDASLFECPQCGDFILSDYTTHAKGFSDSKHLISAWIRRQNRFGNPPPIVAQGDNPEKWIQDLPGMGFPQTVNEKMDELLKAYAQIVKDEFGKFVSVNSYPTLITDVAGKNEAEIAGLNQLLIELGYLYPHPGHVLNDVVRITAKGWQRIAELSKPSFSSDLAFIAMWYGPGLSEYKDSVKAAISECGYQPIIIEDIEFNNFIMNEVVQFIRKARFLVADLTCSPEIDAPENPRVVQGARGGVYWEAGMAFGLGKPVIQTCRDDDCSRRRIHFDLNQYQTIFWRNTDLGTVVRPLSTHIPNPTFAEKLAQRILYTVGRGSYSKPI